MDNLHDAYRASQDFTRWAAFAIEVPDRNARMLDAARELRDLLNKLLSDKD